MQHAWSYQAPTFLAGHSFHLSAGYMRAQVVTNAGNVLEGSRVVVATEGSVVSGKGEEITVKKASVGELRRVELLYV